MSITIPKRVRVLNGITDPLGGSRENLLGGRYEINQIGRPSGIENWLPKRYTKEILWFQRAGDGGKPLI